MPKLRQRTVHRLSWQTVRNGTWAQSPSSRVFLTQALLALVVTGVQGANWDPVTTLIHSECLDCHEAGAENGIELENLGSDLHRLEAYRMWERVFIQIESGEMPPKRRPRPPSRMLEPAMSALESALHQANATRQKQRGRGRARRLTKEEFGHAIQDLLGVSIGVVSEIPNESEGGFDTTQTTQNLSHNHITAYMRAAESALNAVRILENRGQIPEYTVDYKRSPYIQIWYDRAWQDGGDNLRELPDGVASFKTTDFIWRTDRNGFRAEADGLYEIEVRAYAYQARSTVTLLLSRASGDQPQPELIEGFDFQPAEQRVLRRNAFLRKGEYLLPSFSDLDPQLDGRSLFQVGAREYTGEGIALQSIRVRGPARPSQRPTEFERALDIARHTEPANEFSSTTPPGAPRPKRQHRTVKLEAITRAVLHFGVRKATIMRRLAFPFERPNTSGLTVGSNRAWASL